MFNRRIVKDPTIAIALMAGLGGEKNALAQQADLAARVERRHDEVERLFGGTISPFVDGRLVSDPAREYAGG